MRVSRALSPSWKPSAVSCLTSRTRPHQVHESHGAPHGDGRPQRAFVRAASASLSLDPTASVARSGPRQPPALSFYGNVGQVAGRDIVTRITLTEEIVSLALQELNRRPDIDEATRRAAGSLIERARGRTTEVLVDAVGTDVGAIALQVIGHVARSKGLWPS